MICYPTPKINIGLNVLRKREDGYHDLETLFYPVDAFHDELEITPAETFSIEIDGADWDPSSDLTARAYRLMVQRYGIGPVAIRMKKGIPVGAGLGGGSSDCAFAIRMINELFSLGLDEGGMESLAGELGSDCAFFVRNIPQWGEGRGELLSPAEFSLEGYEIRLELPEKSHVSTAEAYRGIKPCTPALRLKQALDLPPEQWEGKVVNDFEESVFPAHPEILALKKKMYADGAVYASMTGSGSAVFGIFKKQ